MRFCRDQAIWAVGYYLIRNHGLTTSTAEDKQMAVAGLETAERVILANLRSADLSQLSSLAIGPLSVVVTWPYSSVKQRVQLLLAEPPYHQQRVRAVFIGPAATSFAQQGVKIGDALLLALAGAVLSGPDNGHESSELTLTFEKHMQCEVSMNPRRILVKPDSISNFECTSDISSWLPLRADQRRLLRSTARLTIADAVHPHEGSLSVEFTLDFAPDRVSVGGPSCEPTHSLLLFPSSIMGGG